MRHVAMTALGVAFLCSCFASSSVRSEDEPATPSPSTKASEDKTPAGQKLETALQLRKLKKYDEALAAFKEAQGLNPSATTSAEIQFRVGETHFKKGQEASEGKTAGVEADPQFKQAIQCFEDVTKRFPKEEITPEAAYMIGSSYLVLGDTERALAAYQKAYDEFPTHKARPRSLLRVGVCQAGLDEPVKARATFQRWLNENESNKVDTPKVEKYLKELALVGRPAPALRVNEWLMGNVGPNGLSTFDGEVVVLVFFATWCENCSAEMPHLRSLMSKWAPQGVVFIGVSDPDDPKNTHPVDVYVKKNSLDFTDVALDRKEASWVDYRVSGLPASVVIDRKGKVRWRGHLAFFPPRLVEKALKE